MTHPRESISHPGYASIMVPVDLGTACKNRIRLAGALADRFGARLIGIAGREVLVPYYEMGCVPVDARVYEAEEQNTQRDLAAAETVFREAAGARNDLEWRRATTAPTGFVACQARSADLLVVGRRGPKDPGQGLMAVDPGDLVMSAGRPLLVVPPEIAHLSPKRVVIAWKNTREARRAVWDSLHLLRRAESVFVASVDDEPDREGVADVAAYLTRQGIRGALAMTLSDELGAGAEAGPLMRFAEAESADLLVAGAYGHSRVGEWLFGGVTRDLLRTASMPCLLSH